MIKASLQEIANLESCCIPVAADDGIALHSPRVSEARLALIATQGKTVLGDLFCSQPLRLLFPFPVEGELFQAVLACVSGGVLGGDRFKIDVQAGDHTKTLVVGQAAEKIYRTKGPDSVIENTLEIGAGAWLEWLPQETIIFDHARLRRKTVVHMRHGSHFLGGEILVFGRVARGEHLTQGLVHDGWEIYGPNGILRWKDVLHMEGDLTKPLTEAVSFGGARAYATIIYVHGTEEKPLSAVREIVSAHANASLKIGVTVVRDILLVRMLGRDVFDLRVAYAGIWQQLRYLASGMPEKMPRLWNV